VTETIGKIAAAYKVSCVQGVLSHSLERFVIDGTKVMLNRTETDVLAEEFTFEANQIFAIDIVMSTAEVSKQAHYTHAPTVSKHQTLT